MMSDEEEDITMVESIDEPNNDDNDDENDDDQDSDIPTSTNNKNIGMHACDVEITFPTALQAQQAMEILQVDQEPSNRVTKSFRLGTASRPPHDAETSVVDSTTTTTTTMTV
jgi:Transcription factor Pcc1